MFHNPGGHWNPCSEAIPNVRLSQKNSTVIFVQFIGGVSKLCFFGVMIPNTWTIHSKTLKSSKLTGNPFKLIGFTHPLDMQWQKKHCDNIVMENCMEEKQDAITCKQTYLYKTLPETNSSPLKIGHPYERKLVFQLQPSIFRGKLAVSFREGITCIIMG